MIIEFKPSEKQGFLPGQLVVASFAWDSESKYRISATDDVLVSAYLLE